MAEDARTSFAAGTPHIYKRCNSKTGTMDSVQDALLGLEDSTHTVVIEGFRAQALQGDAANATLSSKTFNTGGFKWKVNVEVQEKYGKWVVGAFAKPQFTHRVGHFDPLTPRTHLRVRFLNRVRTAEDGFTAVERYKAWKWGLNSTGATRPLRGWGFPNLCTRDKLLERVEDFCTDGNLHVEVSFRALRSCTQEMDATGYKQASDTAISQLLGRLSEHVIDATPTCEQQESTTESQTSGAKWQPLDSCMESTETVEVPVTVPLQEASQLGTASKVRFNGRGVRIVMPVGSHSKLSRDSAHSRSCKEEHLVCSQIVLEHRPKHFRWHLQQRQPHGAENTDVSLQYAPESEAVVDIDHELLQKLPLLATISQDTVAASNAGPLQTLDHDLRTQQVTLTDSENLCKRPIITCWYGIRQQHKEGNDMETSGGFEAPFDAPASACGLACVLMLLEGAASCKQLFGGGSYGPSFAVQTLGMASFLGQEEVEQCAVAAVHVAVLFLLRGDPATGMHAANELVGPSSTFRAHQHEWMQVLETLSPEIVKLVLKEQSALWKDLKPHEVAGQVLQLPDAFIEEWLSGQTTLDLRDASLPLSQTQDLIRLLPAHRNLSVLHLSCEGPQGRPDDTLCVLKALNRALAAMPQCRLRVLGLHGARQCTRHLKEFTGLCSALQGRLTGFAISVSRWEFEHGDEDKLVFFQALARLTRLRVLALSPWGQLVGTQNLSVLAPMQRLDRLKVLVHENTASDDVAPAAAIVPGFRFYRADSSRFKV